MVLLQEQTVIVNPAMDIVKSSVLSAFTFLAAFSIRDVIIKTMESLVSTGTKQKLVFIYLYSAMVVFITILLAFLWQDNAENNQ